MDGTALRERIQLYESRMGQADVKVLNLRLNGTYALADIIVNGVQWLNRKYPYRRFFLKRYLKGAK